MERNPLHNLSHEELVALVLRLQDEMSLLNARDLQHGKELAAQAKRNQQQAKLMDRQAKRIAELESEVRELRKKNPTQRLNEAYSVKAEENLNNTG